MKVLFKEINLLNFKNHKSLNLILGDITRISGMNGVGKTTIGEVAAFVLYGCDLLGKKLEPEPLNYSYDRVFASLLVSIDGIDILLAREIANGKNVFYINDVPKTATEYKTFVDSLFEKEMFLSLYNPAFFFSQKWEDQRKQIMKYVSAPLNADVFAAMSGGKDLNPYAKRLETELKKASAADLKAKHTKNKNDKEKLYTQAQGSVKTLQDQIKAFAAVPDVDLVKLAADDVRLNAEIKAIEDGMKVALENNKKMELLDLKIVGIIENVSRAKARYMTVHGEVIDEACKTCKQALDEAAVEAVKKDKDTRKAALKAEYDALIAERNAEQAALAALEKVDTDEQVSQITSLKIQMLANADANRKQQQKDALSGQLEVAKKLEAEHLASNKDSIFVLDAIKSFNASEASLQVSKVEALFTRLKVRLFNHIESTDEYKPFFMIQMDGKDYTTLSVGEKIAAGLELLEVLHLQSKMVVPCFIDDEESYTGEIKVYGQVIFGTVVKGQKLQINGIEVSA